jgi:hypothetical protein
MTVSLSGYFTLESTTFLGTPKFQGHKQCVVMACNVSWNCTFAKADKGIDLDSIGNPGNLLSFTSVFSKRFNGSFDSKIHGRRRT